MARALQLSRSRSTPTTLRAALDALELRRGAVAGLPFLPGDATAGTESELQVAVAGRRESVDLPRTILESAYFANLRRRAARGELSRGACAELEELLAGNRDEVWENSWVRFELGRLAPAARATLAADLAADKSRPRSGRRSDAGRFLLSAEEGPILRLPVSYVLKLALADAAGGADLPASLRESATRLAACFSNDNTSPETTSFSVLRLTRPHPGRSVARECAKRFLLTQLLAEHANLRFGLAESGQRILVFQAPNPPQRQRRLNRLVSDSFYRELFVSPCLSGWDRGEEKSHYMALCHQALSRSQLNAVAKMREAGILRNNLVTLPSTSNLSLSNNGTHLSLGSQLLSRRRGEGGGFGAAEEKLTGDLAIKIAEHFLPLFVGTYSAAPVRLGFADFHPEKLLGFLPHELDFTHLRMLWRRWRGKADLDLMGRSLTPFGPPWIDRLVARVCRLRGDLVPDFRLLDYPVALASSETQPALDGNLGNVERLRADLDALGVIDQRMALYLPLRLREVSAHGYAGVEARFFSLFEGFERDLGGATELQLLVMALAWKWIVDGKMTHERIPDRPEIESERRQLLFAAAIGVPTIYVREGTSNLLLAELLGETRRVRSSRRYPGYLRVDLAELRRSLLRLLRREGAELVEALGLGETLDDLAARLEERPGASATQRLVAGILGGSGRSPLELDAEEFNAAAERYYRQELRQRQLAEAAELFLAELDRWEREAPAPLLEAAHAVGCTGGGGLRGRAELARFVAGNAAPAEVERLIRRVVLTEARAAAPEKDEPAARPEETPPCDISSWTAARAV